jgi:chaperonin GroES
MSIRPLGDRVLVKRDEPETITKGGIIIPDNAQEKQAKGKVVAVGKGNRDVNGNIHTLDVKVGDKILFSKFAGTEVKIDDENLIIMKEIDILGIIE